MIDLGKTSGAREDDIAELYGDIGVVQDANPEANNSTLEDVYNSSNIIPKSTSHSGSAGFQILHSGNTFRWISSSTYTSRPLSSSQLAICLDFCATSTSLIFLTINTF